MRPGQGGYPEKCGDFHVHLSDGINRVYLVTYSFKKVSDKHSVSSNTDQMAIG